MLYFTNTLDKGNCCSGNYCLCERLAVARDGVEGGLGVMKPGELQLISRSQKNLFIKYLRR